jgi:hypothetical protein
MMEDDEVSRLREILMVCCLCGLFILACHQGHGLSPDLPGIEGNISFQGTWPDSTAMVLVVAITRFPWNLTDYDSLVAYFFDAFVSGDLAYSDPIPLGTDQYAYKLFLEPGLWERISVVWFPDDLYGLKEIGSYFETPGLENPSSVEVITGSLTQQINITADFSHVDSASPFLEPGESREVPKGVDP